MTSPERRALLFLSAVAVLGTGARLARTEAAGPAATVETRRALARQIAAVDSVRAAEERKARERKERGGRRRTGDGTLGVESGVRGGGKGRGRRNVGGGAASSPGAIPVWPPVVRAAPGTTPEPGTRSAEPIDVDRATASELETLPGIGPALAERIVADRNAAGAFGSLEGLERVRGIGPAMAGRLRGRVTFSGVPRQPGADRGASSSAPSVRRSRSRPPGRA